MLSLTWKTLTNALNLKIHPYFHGIEIDLSGEHLYTNLLFREISTAHAGSREAAQKPIQKRADAHSTVVASGHEKTSPNHNSNFVSVLSTLAGSRT